MSIKPSYINWIYFYYLNLLKVIPFAGSHDIYSMRDMRDALGALGPVDGTNPELNNLTCSLTYCEAGDIVFLTSDGISDNFDPVVGKFAIPRKETPTASKDSQINDKEQQNGVQDGRGNEPSKEEQSKQQSHPSSSRQGQQAAGRQQQQQNNKGSGRQHGSASRQHHSQHSSGRQQQQQQRGGRVRRTPSGSKEQAGSGHARAGKQVSGSCLLLYFLIPNFPFEYNNTYLSSTSKQTKR